MDILAARELMFVVNTELNLKQILPSVETLKIFIETASWNLKASSCSDISRFRYIAYWNDLYSKNWFCVLGSQNNPGHLQHDLSASPGNWIYPYDFLINLTYTTFKCIHSTVDCQLLQEPPMFAKEALCRYVLQINTLWYRVSNVVCSAQLPWLEILCKQYSCCVRSQLSKEKLGLLGLDV